MAITPRSKGLGNIGAIVDRQGRASVAAPVKPTSVSKPKIAAPERPGPRPVVRKPATAPAPKPVAKVAPKPVPKLAPKPSPFKPVAKTTPAPTPQPAPGQGGYKFRQNVDQGQAPSFYVDKNGNPVTDQMIEAGQDPYVNNERRYKSPTAMGYQYNPEYAAWSRRNDAENQARMEDINNYKKTLGGGNDYWMEGIDWDTGQASGKGGEFIRGTDIYKTGADGSYTDMRTGKRYYNAAPPSFTGGTEYDFKELQPGQAIPKPTFKPGFGFDNIFGTPGQGNLARNTGPGNAAPGGNEFYRQNPGIAPPPVYDFGGNRMMPNPDNYGPPPTLGVLTPEEALRDSMMPGPTGPSGNPYEPMPQPGDGMYPNAPPPGYDFNNPGMDGPIDYSKVGSIGQPGGQQPTSFDPNYANRLFGIGPAFGATDDYGVGVSGFGGGNMRMPNSFDDSEIRRNSPSYNGGVSGIAGLFGNNNLKSAFSPQSNNFGGGGFMGGGGSGSLFGGGGFAGK